MTALSIAVIGFSVVVFAFLVVVLALAVVLDGLLVVLGTWNLCGVVIGRFGLFVVFKTVFFGLIGWSCVVIFVGMDGGGFSGALTSIALENYLMKNNDLPQRPVHSAEHCSP